MIAHRLFFAFAALTLASVTMFAVATERIGAPLAGAFGFAFTAFLLVGQPGREFLAWLLDLLAPPPLRIDGQPVDPATQNALRHEAGMRPLTG